MRLRDAYSEDLWAANQGRSEFGLRADCFGVKYSDRIRLSQLGRDLAVRYDLKESSAPACFVFGNQYFRARVVRAHHWNNTRS